jgi:dsDNA-specific endonuclease/ATPase MutS2
MPEETKIDIGDSEESPVDVKLGEEPEKTKEPEIQVEDAPQEEELEEYSAGVKKRIGDLTHKWREAERQQQTAVQFAENVRLENDNLKTRLDSLDKGYQEEFGERVSSQLNSAKKLLKEAHESGDVDKIVEAQEALSNLSFEKTRLAKAKKETAQQVQQPQPQVQQPQPQPAAQPDPKAEAWATANDWFGKDEIMTYAAFGVHRRLIEDEGFDPKSDQYYAEIDKRLRSEFPHKFESKSKSNGGSRKVASAEASASRNRSGRKTVRLTSSQVAIAKRLNVPLEEYAKYVK